MIAITAGRTPEALTNLMKTIAPNIERIAVFFTNCFIEALRERTEYA